MTETTLFSLSAIVALLPSSLLAMRRDHRRDTVFWLVLAVAVVGPLAWTTVRLDGSWRTDVSTALWVTVAATMLIFAVVAAISHAAWRLTPLLAPYMMVVAALAAVWQGSAEKTLDPASVSAWVKVHIPVSVTTYGLVTVAAVAALAAFLQERALKRKQPTRLTALLPSVADCERLLVRLLSLGGLVLAFGLLSGMATQYVSMGSVLVLDHKSVLTVTAFLVIAALLLAHVRTGIRGRKAARVVLLAYLLLTLAYPGVKFVNDVLIRS